jgi:anti-sigma B factor antagonist
MSPELPLEYQIVNPRPREALLRFLEPVALHEPQNLLLSEQLDEIAQDVGAGNLLLDLANVKYITSTTLTLLTGLNRKLQTMGGTLSVRGVSPQVYEIFEITRLNMLLDVHAAS